MLILNDKFIDLKMGKKSIKLVRLYNIDFIISLIYRTRNTPIGVVVRELSAVNHYFRGDQPPKLGFGRQSGGQK